MIKSSNNRNYLKRNRLYDQLINIVIAVFIALTIRIFIFPSIVVKTNSMSPILEGNEKGIDHVIINKIKFFFDKPLNGNIVAFINSIGEIDFGIIKACPSDKIYSENKDIYINEDKFRINEKNVVFIGDDYLNWTQNKPYILPKDTYLIVNYDGLKSLNKVTYDFISKNKILGKVIFIYWPVNRIKKIIS